MNTFSYVCEKCGREYSYIDDWRERDCGGVPCAPICDCGGEIAYAIECDICGRIFPSDDEYGSQFCEKCKKELYAPKNISKFFEDDDKKETLEVNPLFLVAFGEDGINEILLKEFSKLDFDEVKEVVDELATEDELLEILS